MVMSTMVDMIDKGNKVQDLLRDTRRNLTSFLSTPCQELQGKMVYLRDEIEP